MKNLLILLSSVLLFSCNNTPEQKPYCSNVINVTTTSWQDTVIEQITTEPHTVRNGLIGATVGHFLVGGWTGKLAGAAIGASIGNNQATSYTQKKIVNHTQYNVILADSFKFTSDHWYQIGYCYQH